MRRTRLLASTLAIFWLSGGPIFGQTEDQKVGVLPRDDSGRPLNLDFESGDLRDWTATGDAFLGTPIEGDVVAKRRGDMKSGHQGRFWVGTFERSRDTAVGTLISSPFRLTKPFASFLIGGGFYPETRVEIVDADNSQVLFTASGEQVSSTEGSEEMRRVVADLKKSVGHRVQVKVIDEHRGHWGHLNFDDFRINDTPPVVVPRIKPPTPDNFANEGLSPEDAARAMTVPPGFSVSLFAGEPDVVQPIALAIDDRGRLWVAEAYSYPHRVAPEKARDRILIFEDTDGDGHFDVRKVFADRLNLVSGLEVGFGGVWVGAAPELLFIADKNGDDVPDGPPVVVLDGWGAHDTHEMLNSFAWGPDGRLYGCHGVFTHSRVGKPGTPDKDRTAINAGIWRYDPTTRNFEVFAHGTSNPWGIDWDQNGRAFITSCVIPHLYQMNPGARYERQAGPHFNPFTYDDIKTIADHRHYVGAAGPHAGNGRSDSAGGGHAHCGAMIYQGGSWPDELRGSIFMNNIHGARLNRDTLAPKGSGFIGSHAPDFLLANDRWSQIISLKYGPDGNVFMIDWYDKNQCHQSSDSAHDRSNGRIFKVSHGDKKPVPVNLKSLASVDLVALMGHPNEWFVRHALRILKERGPDPSLRPALKLNVFARPDDPARLRTLWALEASGNLDEGLLFDALNCDSAPVRAWAVRFATESRLPSQAMLGQLSEKAAVEASPVVRLELASSLQKLPYKDRWNLLTALLNRVEDISDPNIPLMLWYAAEPLAEVDPSAALRLALGSLMPRIDVFMVRRIAAIGTPEAIEILVNQGLRGSPSPEQRRMIVKGMNEAFKGRRSVPMPAAWPDAFAQLIKDEDAEMRSQVIALAVTFGDPRALASLREVLVDVSSGKARRLEALESLLKARASDLAPILQSLVADADLRGPAIRGLAAFDDPRTASVILAAYGSLRIAERRDALNTLASRPGFALAMLNAVDARMIPRSDLSADLIRQMRNLKSNELDARITAVWGLVRETPSDRAAIIAATKGMLVAKNANPPDINLGRTLYIKTCSQCHTLFGAGGKVGPELTGSNRADLDYLLSNIYDPSALIGKDYLAHVVATRDGRVLTGIIRSEDKDSIALVTANESLTIPRADIEASRPSDQSMMPEGLLQTLSPGEIRSLVAYLASPSQVPMLATPETAATFFDGKTLNGWRGEPGLWSVEDGEIVGKTSGLKGNEFLRAEMMAEDFQLTVMIKLVANQGNSGIQFRSLELPGGEMKGDQADVGPGWWGKLYEENGRGLLWNDNPIEKQLKPGEWHSYKISALGDHIQTWIDGIPCVDLIDPQGARRGIFAFQLHSGGATEVRLKEIKLEVVPKSAGR